MLLQKFCFSTLLKKNLRARPGFRPPECRFTTVTIIICGGSEECRVELKAGAPNMDCHREQEKFSVKTKLTQVMCNAYNSKQLFQCFDKLIFFSDILQDISRSDFLSMGLLPGDIDLLMRVSQFATNQAAPIARFVAQTHDPAIAPRPAKDISAQKVTAVQPIAHFGDAAKRSSSRPKTRTPSADNDDAPSPPDNKKNQGTVPKGKLLEEIAAEQMFRPTNAKGAKVLRARELCAKAAQSFGAGEFEEAIRDYAEAEALYHTINDNASLDLVVSKRQEAEHSLQMVVFQKKFDRERGQGLLEDGRQKLAKGNFLQAQEILNQAWACLSKAGDMKLAAESARLRDQASMLASKSTENGTKAELQANVQMLEQPSSLVRSAQEQRENEQKELERQRNLKQEQVGLSRIITFAST